MPQVVLKRNHHLLNLTGLLVTGAQLLSQLFLLFTLFFFLRLEFELIEFFSDDLDLLLELLLAAYTGQHLFKAAYHRQEFIIHLVVVLEAATAQMIF